MRMRIRLNKHDIDAMTEGQREILFEGVKMGSAQERKILIKIIESGKWVGETLEEDIANLKAMMRGEK